MYVDILTALEVLGPPNNIMKNRGPAAKEEAIESTSKGIPD